MQTANQSNDSTHTDRNTTASFTVDPMHTTVGFSVRHLMISNVRGSFGTVSGNVRWNPENPSATRIDTDIAADSIDTNQAQRDAHLRSPEFFDVEKYPLITFRSQSARAVAAGAVEVTGNLTIRGIEKPMTLLVTEISKEQKDHRGFTRVGALATAKIKRSDFNMTYNPVLEAGGVAVGDEITLTFDVSLLKEVAK